MAVALAQARHALVENEVPIGAAAVLDGEVLSVAHWRLQPDFQLLGHPELIVLREAESAQRLHRPQRASITLYSTVEPCLLCMGAAMAFMAGRVVFALEAPSDGASHVAERWQPTLGHPPSGFPYTIPEVISGVGREESLELMRVFVERNPDAEWAKTLLPPRHSGSSCGRLIGVSYSRQKATAEHHFRPVSSPLRAAQEPSRRRPTFRACARDWRGALALWPRWRHGRGASFAAQPAMRRRRRRQRPRGRARATWRRLAGARSPYPLHAVLIKPGPRSQTARALLPSRLLPPPE